MQAVLTHAPTFEAAPPEFVGNRRSIVLGRYSGTHSAGAKLRELGLSLPQQAIEQLLEEVEAFAVAEKRPPSDGEIAALANAISPAAAVG